VSGVKGEAEDDFRSGDVSLSLADLGAEAALNKTGELTNESTDDQYPAAKAVYSALAIKVDKNNTLQKQLYASTAYTLVSPSDRMTKEIIFANPPLGKMSDLSYDFFEFVAKILRLAKCLPQGRPACAAMS
jgi:hypothetical protein